jgi:hypothetical protein
VQILRDDGIIRRFHDRREPSSGERRLRPFADVAGDFEAPIT